MSNQKELFPRCSSCGAILGWPYVEMTFNEKRLWKIIYDQEQLAHSVTELVRLLGWTVESENAVRCMLSRLNKKLKEAGACEIRSAPYRIVKFEVISNPATQVADTSK